MHNYKFNIGAMGLKIWLVLAILSTWSCAGEQSDEISLTTFLPNGAKFKGKIVEGLFEGKGILIEATGDSYEGQFRNGVANGVGVFKGHAGDRYEGEFKGGICEGKGTLVLPSGDRYEGGFRDGHYDGIGIFKGHAGDQYEGEFKNGKYDGRGVLSFASGSIVEGEFEAGKLIDVRKRTFALFHKISTVVLPLMLLVSVVLNVVLVFKRR